VRWIAKIDKVFGVHWVTSSYATSGVDPYGSGRHTGYSNTVHLITQLQCNECSFNIIKTTEVPGEAVLSTYMQKNRSAAEALLPDPNVGA